MDSAALIVAYESGTLLKKLGEAFGLKPNGVFYYLKKAGKKVSRRQRKFDCNDDLFSTCSEEGLYWLGFCAADGYINGNEVQLSLAKKDRVVLEGFKKALQTSRRIYDYWNREFPKSSLFINSERLSSDLRAFSGSTVLRTPQEKQHHLVRGIFDGDGSVSCHDYQYGTVKQYSRQVRICGSRSILEAIQKVVVSRAGTSQGVIRLVRGIHEWSLGGAANAKLFRDWLYKDSTIFLSRKKNAFTLLDRVVVSRQKRL